MARYDRYDAWRRGPYVGWYPGAYWAGAPMFGWGGWATGFDMWPPYAPVGYGAYDRRVLSPRRPPRESPTYGRGGDHAARRWAREHGYDEGYTVRPHRGRGRGARYPW